MRRRQGGIVGHVRALAVAHPWTSAAVAAAAAAAAAGGAAVLALLGLHHSWAADASARPVGLQHRAAGGGQRRLLCLAMAAQSSGVVWAAVTGQR